MNRYVVSYRNSTSNHNQNRHRGTQHYVVSYRNSTSNHNSVSTILTVNLLYLIEILHQTTTVSTLPCPAAPLYLIEILHQTTTRPSVAHGPMRLYLIEILHQTTTCSPVGSFLFTLYLIEILHQTTTVEDQFGISSRLYLIEILHQTTTRECSSGSSYRLYLIEILHQTTTWTRKLVPGVPGCILSKFYIKPQQQRSSLFLLGVVSYRNSTSNHNKVVTRPLGGRVVSYRNSTSNHNMWKVRRLPASLYLIEILHQTTTSGLILIDKVLLTGCLPL